MRTVARIEHPSGIHIEACMRAGLSGLRMSLLYECALAVLFLVALAARLAYKDGEVKSERA